MAERIPNLPIPDLDDETFEDLVKEARARIPLYAPKWTDHNLSDPGITFLDLLAWLAEMQIYSLNLLPDRNYRKFLKLLGERPKPAAPAGVDVTFPAQGRTAVRVPRGSQVVAREKASDVEVVFETDSDLTVLPADLKKIVSLVDYRYTDHTEANKRVGIFYHAFGEKASEDSILYLGLNYPVDKCKKGGIHKAVRRKEATMDIYLYEADLSARGRHGQELPHIVPPAKLVWEYWRKEQWTTLKLNVEVRAVGLTSMRTAAARFMTTPLDAVTPAIRLNPMKGTVDTVVTVAGSNFTPEAEVQVDFGHSAAISTAKVDSSGEFTADFTVPEHPAEAVEVWAMEKTSAQSAVAQFMLTRVSDPPPLITLNPSEGSPGTMVTITGRNFVPQERVRVSFGACSWGDEIITGDDGGFTATLLAPVDETSALYRSGKISFHVPSDMAQHTLPSFEEDNLFWISCKVEEADYEIPPRIDTIELNTISATQGQSEEHETLKRKDERKPGLAEIEINEEKSSGLPGQVFRCQNSPIIAGTQVVTVKEPNGNQNMWIEKGDLDASGPEDNHYLLRPDEGEIVFGNGVNGRIPPKGSEITLDYRFGGGEIGNIPANATWNPQIQAKKGAIISVKNIKNKRPALGGAEAESIEAAQARIRKDLKVPYRAVTAEDYKLIAQSTPGLRVARAHAVALHEENLVKVTVVPESPESTLDPPVPSQEFLDAVCRHLDMHRLITTNLSVIKPEYVTVSVDANVRIKPQNDPAVIEEKIKKALSDFLHPLRGGSDKKGWPFGRSVYQSEIYAAIEDVDGVDCVTRLTLRATDNTDNYEYQNGNIDIQPLCLVYSGTHNIEIRVPEIVCRE
jgi:hypothetical protein